MHRQSLFPRKSKRPLALFAFFTLLLTAVAAPSLAYAWSPLDLVEDFAGTTFGFVTGPVAGIAQTIANAFLNVLTIFIFRVPLAISSVFYVLSATILGWVSDENFIPFSITGQDNAVVYNAWQLMRDFANMGFILALVAIALGTALRIGEYQLQRALPRLIMIALLINFTPVFVGLIIDVSNIAMRFFLDKVGANFFEASKKVFSFGLDMITGIVSKEPTEYAAAIIAQIFFNAVGALIFFLFSMLFFARYVALWILFILSPLAFFSMILPITKRFWNMWWHQFMQWCFIGVSGAFFLYLGSQMTAFMWDNGLTTPNVPAEGAFWWFSDFFGALAVMLVPIAILIMGFFISLSTSAMGASTVTNIARTAGTWMATKGKTWGKQRYQVARETVNRSAKTRMLTERMATMETMKPTWGEGQRGLGGWVKRRAADVVGIGPETVASTSRVVGKRALGEIVEAEPRDTARAKEEAKKLQSPQALLSELRSAATRAQKVGVLQAATEKKLLNTLKDLGLKEEEILKPIEDTVLTNPPAVKDFVYSDLQRGVALYERAQTKFTEGQRKAAGLWMSPEENKNYGGKTIYGPNGEVLTQLEGSFERKLMATAMPKHIENWSVDSLRDPNTKALKEEVKVALREQGTGQQLSALGKTFGRDIAEQIGRYLKDEVGTAWLEAHNKPLLNYLKHNNAQELGFEEPTGTVATPPPPKPAPYMPGGGAPPTPPGGGPQTPPGGGGPPRERGYMGLGTEGGQPTAEKGETGKERGYKGPGV